MHLCKKVKNSAAPVPGRAATAPHVFQVEALHHGIEAAKAKKTFVFRIEAEAMVADIYTKTGKLVKARNCSLKTVQPKNNQKWKPHQNRKSLSPLFCTI